MGQVTRNEHTGDPIQTKEVTESYRQNYDLIFRKCRTCDKPIGSKHSPLCADQNPLKGPCLVNEANSGHNRRICGFPLVEEIRRGSGEPSVS